LQKIYERENLKAYDETNVHFNENNLIKTRVDINGFEMVSYKTEKIIGALDFIDKIIEYSYLVNTEKYIKKIKEISKKFMPNVYEALNQEKTELLLSKKDYNDFIVGHNKLVIKFNYY